MTSPERPSKQEAFVALLREGWTSLHLDARRPGVIVPAHLRGEAHLVLQYGHDLPIPIPDLEIDDYGVRATLSFSKTPHLTVVPWSAVYVVACDDGRGVLYHEDVPEDVSIIATRASADRALSDGDLTHEEYLEAGGGRHAAARARRLLRSVPADPAAAAAPLPEQLVAARRRRKPQLRLVK
jgi:stringent starvation protein B